MAEIRSRRARVRLRTVLIGAPFLVSGVAFTSLGVPQELPTDLLEKVMRELVSIPIIDDVRQVSIPTPIFWIVGFGVAALAIRKVRGERPYSASLEGPEAGTSGAEAVHSGLDGAHSVLDASAAPDVEQANVVRSRRNKPRKPPEILKLPPHVVALLEKSAAARAAGRAALSSESRGDHEGRGGLDVTLPSYDPWRDED